MKLNKEELKTIIKEELNKVLLKENDLIEPDMYGEPGHRSYLISPRYISRGNGLPSEPDYLADIVSQALMGTGDVSYQQGVQAAIDLLKIITSPEGHPLITTKEESKNDIIDFLYYALDELQ